MHQLFFMEPRIAGGVGAIVIAALLSACAGGPSPPPAEPTFYRSLAGPNAEVDAAAAASMISGYRRNNGLNEVQVDPVLMQLALDQARAMALSNKLGHDVNGNFKSRLARAGFANRVAVENVSAGYHTLAEAFSGWRDSAPHRANMLQNGVTRMGIAAVYSPSSKYKVFWTLVLAASEDRRS